MYKALKQLFGIKPGVDYANLLLQGALILDVRTPVEFGRSHIEGAVNIPIEKLREHLHQLVKDVPIIACCVDGSKSWYAKNLLDANGFKHVIDAGDWLKLQRKLQRR